jgi:hypothetical protein
LSYRDRVTGTGVGAGSKCGIRDRYGASSGETDAEGEGDGVNVGDGVEDGVTDGVGRGSCQATDPDGDPGWGAHADKAMTASRAGMARPAHRGERVTRGS